MSDELEASIQAAIVVCQEAGHLRLRAKVSNDISAAVAAARKQVVRSYGDEAFMVDEDVRLQTADRYKATHDGRSFEQDNVKTIMAHIDGEYQECAVAKELPKVEARAKFRRPQGLRKDTYHEEGDEVLRVGQADCKAKALANHSFGAARLVLKDAPVMALQLLSLGNGTASSTTGGSTADACSEVPEESDDEFTDPCFGDLTGIMAIGTRRIDTPRQICSQSQATVYAPFIWSLVSWWSLLVGGASNSSISSFRECAKASRLTCGSATFYASAQSISISGEIARTSSARYRQISGATQLE